MATKKLQDDLFGGLSDSDDEHFAHARHTSNVLLDMEMSSEDDRSSKEGQSSSSSWDNLTGKKTVSEGETFSEQHYKHPKVIFTLSSGDEDMDSASLEISHSKNNIEQQSSSTKRAFERDAYPLGTTPKRPKRTEFHRAMSALEGLSSVESVENAVTEAESSIDWLTMRVPPNNIYEKKMQHAAPVTNDRFNPSLLQSKKINCPQSTLKGNRPSEKSSVKNFAAPLKPLVNPFSARNDAIRQRVLTENTDETRRLKETILLANFSKEQLERYEAYRRSSFGRGPIKKIITEITGVVPSDRLLLTMRSLTKMFVGDIVEEAVDLREARGETDEPLKPAHIRAVFRDLVSQGKLWPPFGHKS